MDEKNSQDIVEVSNKNIFRKIGSLREIIIFGLVVLLFVAFFFTSKGIVFYPDSLYRIPVPVLLSPASVFRAFCLNAPAFVLKQQVRFSFPV